jgi:hypothetical protein
MQSEDEIPAVNRGLKRWCKATGMRENTLKREGLKMGLYRGDNTIHPEIAWAKEGEWIRCLGVPIGNELDEQKWWKRKIEEVRCKAEKWVALHRQGYHGRNLVVQAMYFGSLRFWLYSIFMDKQTTITVQKDADILWWAREPRIEEGKRVRRWIAAKTAIGPRSRGGINNMDWAIHTSSFYAQWILRYVHPAQSSWKDLLDYFILTDERGNLIYPEGRSIVMSNLSVNEKRRMLLQIPTGATYVKECLKAFWDLKLKPVNPTEMLQSQHLWHSHKFGGLEAPYYTKRYFKDVCHTYLFSDLVDATQNMLFDYIDWKEMIDDYEYDKEGVRRDNNYISQKATQINRVLRKLPGWVRDELTKQEQYTPEHNETVAFIKGEDVQYAIYSKNSPPKHEILWIDAVGIAHPTGLTREFRKHKAYKITVYGTDWDTRIVGPESTAFPHNIKWKIGTRELFTHELTIKVLTQARTHAKMKPPACEEAWNSHLGVTLPWKQIWKIKGAYSTPRDEITWLKLIHRNLFVANNDKTTQDKSCRCAGCNQPETMQHLADCPTITQQYWKKVEQLMTKLGMSKPTNLLHFCITGIVTPNKTAKKEQATVWPRLITR